MSLPEMTDTECDELREIALAMPVEHVAASSREFAKHLQFIAATLPSKNIDEESGQQRTAVYARILGGYTNAALSYMSERVCRELDWFPTPHQCLEILANYNPPVTRKDRALRLCADHLQARFEAFRERLRTEIVDQCTIDAIPERWKRIFENEGRMRLVDGHYQQRLREI